MFFPYGVSIQFFTGHTDIFQSPQKWFFSLSDRDKIFTSNWLWIEICENVVLSKSILLWRQWTKNFEIDKSRILSNLDQLLKIQLGT